MGRRLRFPRLNFALSQAKVPENANKKAVRSQLLQQLVDRQLLVEQARSEGIDKTRISSTASVRPKINC